MPYDCITLRNKLPFSWAQTTSFQPENYLFASPYPVDYIQEAGFILLDKS